MQLTLGKTITERQATYTLKMIPNYQRQLSFLGVDIPDHTRFRVVPRKMNLRPSVCIEDDTIMCRFPFDHEIVALIKNFGRSSHGAVSWSTLHSAWTFALTEYNLSWVVAFAQSHKWEIDERCQELFGKILEVEKTPFEIILERKDNQLQIRNAPESMLEYLKNQHKPLDLATMLDYSGELSYTVSRELIEESIQTFGVENTLMFCTNSIRCAAPDLPISLTQLFDWAKITNRYPICIISAMRDSLHETALLEHFAPHEIAVADRANLVGKTKVEKLTFPLDPAIKVVYTKTIINDWPGAIPLLISYQNLYFGKYRRSFANKARKIAYCCTHLPNGQHAKV